MTNMEVAVGLGREARLQSSTVLTFLEVVRYYLLNKVEALFLF